VIEMSRKLASVQIINKIKPIENADNLEIAEVLGWNCVVRKGEFKENQTIVYIETDSFLPIKPEFEFLRKSCYRKMHTGEEGYKIKIIKLRGVFSQGLVFPMTILTNQVVIYKIGDDVTSDLGIIQWQQYVPPELYGKMKGSFPSFLIKTDEIRCLDENTIISTSVGEFTIKEICDKKLVLWVKSYNVNTKSIQFNGVVGHNISDNENDWYEIKTKNKILKVTGNHLLYLSELNKYERVDKLKKGDVLEIL
jgi:RNA ligase (TIGR02306 family)